MKVGLINPRMFYEAYKFFPLGLGYLSGALENSKIPWTFYDQHNDWLDTQVLIDNIKRDGVPDLFALSGL